MLFIDSENFKHSGEVIIQAILIFLLCTLRSDNNTIVQKWEIYIPYPVLYYPQHCSQEQLSHWNWSPVTANKIWAIIC